MYYDFNAVEIARLFEATKVGNMYISPAFMPLGFHLDGDGIRFEYFLDEPIMIIRDVIIGHDTEKLIAIQGPPEEWVAKAEQVAPFASIKLLKLILEQL